MSVYNHPLEWAREMDRMMGKGEINKDNYLTDCANAVVYVRETAEKLSAAIARAEKAEAERAALKALVEVRARGCQCGDDDACAFVRERDALVAENKSLLAHSYTKTAMCPTCPWKEINCRCPLYHLPCGLSWGGERPNPPPL